MTRIKIEKESNELKPSRFDYVRYDMEHAGKQSEFKDQCTTLERLIENLLPGSREASLAITKLEECYMWIGKAIRNSQVESGGDGTDQPNRG